MKKFSTIVFAFAVLLTSSIAAAQETGASAQVNLSEVSIEGLPPDIAQCIAMLCAGDAPKECAPADKAEAQKKVAAVTAAQAKRRVRKARLEVRVSRLSTSLHIMDEQTKRELADMRGELERLEEELAALKGYHDLIIEKLSTLETQVAEHEREITELQGEMDDVQETVGDHEDRITDLENSKAALAFGGRLTPLFLCSTDETCYGGLAAGPRFGMVVDGNVISVDAQAMTGFKGENPYGVRIRGGYQIGLSDSVALDTGLSGSFADLDPTLDARSAFVGMELGLVLTPNSVLSLGASAFGGVELDQNDAAGAFGGVLQLGVDLPQ